MGAHHAIGAVGSVAHHLLGDEEIKNLADEVMDQLAEDGLEVNDNNRDFIFGLVHHAIRGIAGVAHHAIGAVRGVAHHLLGDEDKQDYYYGHGYYHHPYHHHYYHGYYGDDVNDGYYGDDVNDD